MKQITSFLVALIICITLNMVLAIQLADLMMFGCETRWQLLILIWSDTPLLLISACAGMLIFRTQPLLFGITCALAATASTVLCTPDVLMKPIFIVKWILFICFAVAGSYLGWWILKLLTRRNTWLKAWQSIVTLIIILAIMGLWSWWYMGNLEQKIYGSMAEGYRTGCESHQSMTPTERYEKALQKLSCAKSENDRFYALNDAAKESFVVGKTNDAQKYAEELLSILPQYKNNWNYGNAVQDSNLVLGRIAVVNGQIDKAKNLLLEAGKSPGSPQMDTFGPNMSLAKDLLEQGEKDVVLKYFELCRKFWEMHDGKLDEWASTVKNGSIPDFGANLAY